MHISRSKAITTLRNETGKSLQTCTDKVNSLPKYEDGKRYKVLLADVKDAIRTLNNPPRLAAVNNIRPLSRKQIERFSVR